VTEPGNAIDTMLLEERRYPPPAEFAAQANAQPEIYDRDFDEFWETSGRERVSWFEDFTKLYEWERPYARWYIGGKLNVCFNCVDRHVEAGRGDRVAYHWEGEPEGEARAISYADLQREVVRFANALKELGVEKGTPVAIYLGMVPELPVAMLACTRLGAPHTVVFGGFSADSLSSRMIDMGCEVLVTQDEAWRRGTTVPLKRTADEAMSEAPKVRACLVVQRTGNDVPMTAGRDTWLHELDVSYDPASCPCEPMDAEDLLFLMYTSGTTATPKGIAHTTGGYLVGVATTHHLIFDLKPDQDVYWCAADIGWITGHSYIVYGPLCNGATSVLYEGTPDFPDKDRWWAIVERYAVTILYTAPTAIRSHMKWGEEHAHRHDLSSLRLLGSVGEPINPEAWMWYREHIGGDRCPVVDTWWQTETGMIMITPLPGVTTTKPGSATRPFPGVEAAVFDDRGNEVAPGGGGYLVLKRPWPRDAARDLRRRRTLPRDLLVDVRQRLLRGRRLPDRRGRRLLAARARRRRDERLRPPDLDDRDRVRARRPPGRRRGGGLLAQGSDDGRGDRGVRDAARRARGLGREARGAPQPRRPQDRPDCEAGEHRLHAGAAEDPQRQDHAPPPARRRGEPRARRHDDARRPDGGERAPGTCVRRADRGMNRLARVENPFL
jgi:acetyl-CoA synthetase